MNVCSNDHIEIVYDNGHDECQLCQANADTDTLLADLDIINSKLLNLSADNTALRAKIELLQDELADAKRTEVKQ